MAVTAMQGAYQHIRSSLGFSSLPRDTLTCKQRSLSSDGGDAPRHQAGDGSHSLVTLACYKANIENEYSGAELAVYRYSAAVPLSGENPAW